MVTVLTAEEVESVCDVEAIRPAVKGALEAQAADRVERPERPHFPVGEGLESAEPFGTALTMPAYIHGYRHYATKLASVHPGNAERAIPTTRAQIALTDAETGRPAAYMPGTRITNVRTGCIGALATEAFAADPLELAVLGAGAQARWQTRAIASGSDVEAVRIHSPSESREECAVELREEGIPATAVGSPAEAVSGATVVVTATTSTEPVFPAEAMDAAALVVAVGAYDEPMQELDPAVLEGARAVYADVPEEAAATGDLLATSLSAADLRPLAAGFDGEDRGEGYIVVESVGSAVMDLAAATVVYDRAREADLGTDVPF